MTYFEYKDFLYFMVVTQLVLFIGMSILIELIQLPDINPCCMTIQNYTLGQSIFCLLFVVNGCCTSIKKWELLSWIQWFVVIVLMIVELILFLYFTFAIYQNCFQNPQTQNQSYSIIAIKVNFWGGIATTIWIIFIHSMLGFIQCKFRNQNQQLRGELLDLS